MKSIVRQIACLLLILAAAPSSAQTVQETIKNAPWTSYEVGKGVVVKTCHFDNLFGGQQDIYVADGDLNSPGVSLKFVSKGDGTRKAMSGWAAGVPSTVAAINGAWADPGNGIPNQFLRIDGIKLAETHPAAQERGGIVLYKSGKVSCLTRPSVGWASLSAPNIMASEVPSVANGKPYEWSPPGARDRKYYYGYRAPRSAVGVTADNHVLFVVIDGRRAPSAIGVTYAQVADLMIALGAVNATELDGGGSSTLWGANYGVFNSPSDGRERLVALGLCLVAPKVEKPYKAQFLGADYSGDMGSGKTQTVTLNFRNTGTKAWDQNIRLRTTEPRGRKSVFQSDGWLSSNQPCTAQEACVEPGETAHFTFDITAPKLSAVQAYTESFGLMHYQEASLGFEQNRLSITVLPEDGKTDSEIIIESRGGGKNLQWYSQSGAWAESGSSCTAEDTTPGIGMKYGSTFRSKAGLKIAIYRPYISVAGDYEVSVAWGAAGNRRGPITYKVTDTKGVTERQLDQAATANTWISLGTYSFIVGSGGHLEISNEKVDTGGSMYAGPVRFKLVKPSE